MSFFNIKDPVKRHKTIKEYLATIKRIKNHNLQEKAQNFANHEMLKESFEPVVHATTASTEAITKELIPIKEQLEQLTKLVKSKAIKSDLRKINQNNLK